LLFSLRQTSERELAEHDPFHPGALLFWSIQPGKKSQMVHPFSPRQNLYPGKRPNWFRSETLPEPKIMAIFSQTAKNCQANGRLNAVWMETFSQSLGQLSESYRQEFGRSGPQMELSRF
jgi:hypothetical protein